MMNNNFIQFGQTLININYIMYAYLIESNNSGPGIAIQGTNECHRKYYNDVCVRNEEFNRLKDILCNR